MNLESCTDDLFVQAMEGDAEAQFKLGELYRLKNGVGSIDTAAEWFLKAAIQDYAPAQMALALLYLEGLQPEEYERDARYWLQKATQNGCEKSSKFLLELSPEDEDSDTAVLMAEVEEGNPKAQFEIGSMLYFGIGLNKSPYEGLRLIQKAALAGHVGAQVLLGYAYLFGASVVRNEAEAIKWLWLSAQQENAEAYYYLGACYCEAWGVAKNYEQAAACLLKSAEMGNANAQYHLSRFYHDGIGLPANSEQAEAWCYAAALQDNEWAKEMLKYL